MSSRFDPDARVTKYAHGADLSAVALVLEQRRQEILARWLEAAKHQPFHAAHSPSAVADHIPALFDALQTLLRRHPRSGERAPLDDPAVLKAAEAHARQRVEQGMAARQVAAEFRLLRQEIGRALRAHLPPETPTDDALGAELLVDDALDSAVYLALSAIDEHEAARRRAEAALRETGAELARLAAIVESSRDAIIGLDLEGTITSWNAGATRLYGYTPEETLGRSIELLIPEERAGELEGPLARVRHGEAVDQFEAVRTAKDGRRISVSVSLSPVRDPAGAVAGAAVIARDISAHRHAEAALRVSEARTRAIVDAALDCVITMNRDGIVTGWNPAAERTFGRSTADAVGKELASLIIPPSLREAHRRGLSTYLATSQGPVINQRVEIDALRADGSEFPVELTVAVLPADAGTAPRRSGAALTTPGTADTSGTSHTAGTADTADASGTADGADSSGTPNDDVTFVGFVRDLTARRRAEAEREALLAAVTHDLKNPLAAIKGIVQVLRRQAVSGRLEPDRLATRLATVDEAVTRMAAQLTELSEVARAGAGNAPAAPEAAGGLDGMPAGAALDLERAPADLVSLVRDIAASYQLASDTHQIDVVAADPEVIGEWDGTRLERVVDNLLSNAVKYSPSGGRITVTVARDTGRAGPVGDWALLAVRDEGMGIPEADLPRVFERFRRAGNVGRIAGSGIGLAAAKQIVEAHGGEISVESREGQGSVFTVRLPLCPV